MTNTPWIEHETRRQRLACPPTWVLTLALGLSTVAAGCEGAGEDGSTSSTAGSTSVAGSDTTAADDGETTAATGSADGTGTDGAPTTGTPGECWPSTELRSELQGTWSGTLVLEQTYEGVTDSMMVDAYIELGPYSAPTRTITALGMVGEWSCYVSGGGGKPDLSPLWTGSASGTVWAYNMFEADGPANELQVDNVDLCVTELTFDWEFEAVYRYADLIDYTLYAYTEPDAPLVTMQAHESLTVQNGRLVVDSSATGTTAAGDPVSLHVTGELQP